MAKSIKKTGKTLKKSQEQSITGIEKVRIHSNDDNRRFLKKKVVNVKPKVWELTNRKTFYNWLYKNFGEYDATKQQSVDNEQIKIFTGTSIPISPVTIATVAKKELKKLAFELPF